ncbi:hypothetical protein QM716_10505 [Rhodococcus sp. IEGM 1409]|nr:hypothetical protein [Rhodococcus sp. IEGM 1409]MDI9900286.1 hypothetical protein [Rhodococcus sp. IEGM 1409]
MLNEKLGTTAILGMATVLAALASLAAGTLKFAQFRRTHRPTC